MSGVELVGLLLGALALIEPVGKALKSASGITKSSAKFNEYILATSLEYHCLAQMFRNESRRIFGNFMTEGDIDIMFGEHGENDPRWRDTDWKDDVRNYLGVFHGEISSAMMLVFRTLSDLSDNIAKFTDLDDLPGPGETDSCSTHTNRNCNSQPIPVKEKSRLERRKEEIKAGFDNLCRYNFLYQSAVNHFLEDKKWAAKATKALMKDDNRRYRIKKTPKAASWTSVAQVIDDLHEATRRLSFALQKVAKCSCHTFHLRLEMVSSTDLSAPLSNPTSCISRKDARFQTLNFNLITLGCPNTPQLCNGDDMILDSIGQPILTNRLSLRIELKPYAKPRGATSIKTSAPSSAIANPAGHASSRPLSSCLKIPSLPDKDLADQSLKLQVADIIDADGGSPSRVVSSKSKFKKSVAFARNSLASVVSTPENRKRKETGILENPRIPHMENTNDEPDNSDQSKVVPEEIQDLCAWLRRLRVPMDKAGQESHPGVLTVDDDIQYLIYEEKVTESDRETEVETEKYESLLDHLSSGVDTLSIAQRMELAHTLAVSLLQLHSSSWIERNWSSKDVMLFLSPDATDVQRQWSPYVAAAFNDITKIQKIAQAENLDKPGYKLSYVVSLGIIFLEIGLSRSLHDGQEDSGTGDRHFDAYMKACGEVKIHSVNMSMGPTYDRVVEICVKWIDSDELDDKAVQQKFYEEVVLGLERCIQTTNSSQERRRRKRRSMP
ncbi:hypothetical protein ABW19_dt0204587 [Dactylella cylindrospora]|nr:hypothetical protein ABW19_dt0204587 [Dactylella cylindrospora]